MGCGCRKSTASGQAILGYQYTSPQGETKTFLKRRDAIQERIRKGGGTIKTKTGPPPST